MASGAHNYRSVVVVRRFNKEAVARDKPARMFSGHPDLTAAADRAIPVARPIACPATDLGAQPRGVVVEVDSSVRTVISQQCRDGVAGSVGRWHRLIEPVLHHRARRIIPVVATQAGEHAAYVRCGRRHARRENFYELASARCDGLAIQTAGVLAPEHWTARSSVGASCAAVARCAAVRGMARRATPAGNKVCAQNVTRGRSTLRK